MVGPEQYADLYAAFEDRQEWLAQTLTTMTRDEYFAFVEFCLSRLDLMFEAKDAAEASRVKGLWLAIARKELELSDFEDGMTLEQRLASRQAATSYYELAKGFYLPEQQEAVEAAWLSAVDRGERFGYRSGAVFEIMAPHSVFREVDADTVP
jgi:hypothetical protein